MIDGQNFFEYLHSSKAYSPDYNHDALDGRSHAVFVACPGGVVSKRCLPMAVRQGGGNRGVVMGFSESSKRRLRRRLMLIPWQKYAESSKFSRSARSMFVTLTYPGEWPESWREWKKHLDVLLHRLYRLGHCLGVVWKLEYQRRGAPHFHVVVFWDERIDLLTMREWFGVAWYEVVGSGDVRHLVAGTSVDVVYCDHRGVGALMSYLCKYLEKDVNFGDVVDIEGGRCWGCGRSVPYEVLASGSMTQVGWFNWLRHVQHSKPESGFLQGLTTLSLGFVVFDDGFDLLELLESAGADFDY